MTDRAKKDGVNQRRGHRGRCYGERYSKTTDHADITHSIQSCRCNTQAISRSCTHCGAGIGRPEKCATYPHETEPQRQNNIWRTGCQKDEQYQGRNLYHQSNGCRSRAFETIPIRPSSPKGTNHRGEYRERQDEEGSSQWVIATHALQVEDDQEIHRKDGERLQRRSQDRESIATTGKETEIKHGVRYMPLP